MVDELQALPFEYIQETDIDEELKCAICKRPFQSPVSLSFCHHTYCEECIMKWLERLNTCPTCRHKVSNNITLSPYSEINTRIVLNQLNRILVRCLSCGQTNIQRGNYTEHEKMCTEKIISCPAMDIRCTWKGKRHELSKHIHSCPYMKLQPIVDELKGELQSTIYRLEGLVNRLETRIEFLLKLINKGNFMAQECTMPVHECKYWNGYSQNIRKQYMCSLCNGLVPHDQISLHSCSGGCICRDCIATEYPDDHVELSNSNDDIDQ